MLNMIIEPACVIGGSLNTIARFVQTFSKFSYF